MRREVNLVVSDDESRRQWEAIAREPTPEEVVSLTETLEILMRNFSKTQRQMIALRLQGYTAVEISRQAACTEWTVHRLLARVRDRLTRLEREAST